MKYTTKHSIAIHKRELKKPNEDFVLTDEKNGIFILLDGVTRVHSEYANAPFESAVCDINKMFSDEVYRVLISNISETDKRKLLRDAITSANEKIRDYRTIKSKDEWVFFPATLGVVALLDGKRLHYACAGDCICALIREGSKIFFGKQFELEALELQGISKQLRYDKYCNHPENELSYTVFNGDDVVPDMFEYSYVDVCENDTLLIASDGISSYVKFEKPETLKGADTQQMISDSSKYDQPPYAKYADDKAIIKISFTA